MFKSRITAKYNVVGSVIKGYAYDIPTRSFRAAVFARYEVVSSKLDRYLQMFKGSESTAKPVVKWALDTLKKDDRVVWFLRNYRADPKLWSDDTKKSLEHFMSMTHLKDIEKLKFEAKWSYDDGINKLQEVEQSAICKLGDKGAALPEQGKKIVDLGSGWAWWDLQTTSDKEEGNAMGHCGNTASPHEGDTVLSLRQEKKIGTATFYQPNLTFILNDGVLGEMKGRANERPSEKYHKYIVKLLKAPMVKHVWGGGYEPYRNFSFDDLSEAEQAEILKLKPDIDLQRLKPINVGNKKHVKEFKEHNTAVDKVRDDLKKKRGEVDDEFDLEDLFNGKDLKPLKDLTSADLDEWVKDTYEDAKKNQKDHRLQVPTAYEAVLRKVKNQKILKENAENKSLPASVRVAAIQNLTDEDALKDLANAGPSGYRTNNVAQHALYKIKDKKFLKDFAFDEQKDVTLRAAALDKLNDKDSDYKILNSYDGNDNDLMRVAITKRTQDEIADIVKGEHPLSLRQYAVEHLGPTNIPAVTTEMAQTLKDDDVNSLRVFKDLLANSTLQGLEQAWAKAKSKDAKNATAARIMVPDALGVSYVGHVDPNIIFKIAEDKDIVDYTRSNALLQMPVKHESWKKIFDALNPDRQEYVMRFADMPLAVKKMVGDKNYAPAVRFRMAIRMRDPEAILGVIGEYSRLRNFETEVLKEAFDYLMEYGEGDAWLKAYETIEPQARFALLSSLSWELLNHYHYGGGTKDTVAEKAWIVDAMLRMLQDYPDDKYIKNRAQGIIDYLEEHAESYPANEKLAEKLRAYV